MLVPSHTTLWTANGDAPLELDLPYPFGFGHHGASDIGRAPVTRSEVHRQRKDLLGTRQRREKGPGS